MTGYQWTVSGGGTITGGGTSIDNTVTITWNTIGAQTVIINYTGANGCTATNATIYDVTVYPLPFDSLSFVNTSSCATCDGSISIIDKSDGSIPITYLWSNGSITSSILDLCPNIYTVTVTTAKGCEKTSTATILAGTNVEQLTIVNTFSPNGDGINDTWVIKNIVLYPDNELTVVNRWGNEVYHVTEYNNKWDGSGLSDGTYFYYLKVTMCGQENTFKGYVTIVR
jgi:gliding motility-associated-like protein